MDTLPLNQRPRKSKSKVPFGWLELEPVGKVVEGTQFIVLKVPLKDDICKNLEENLQFTPAMLMEVEPDIKLIIDLTDTHKYYDKNEFIGNGVKHVKLRIPGRFVPNAGSVAKFVQAVDEFLRSEDGKAGKYIGVHCTHGINRSGYLVCKYMIQRLKINADEALAAFAEARGYSIERDNYIEDLKSLPPHGNYRDHKKPTNLIVPKNSLNPKGSNDQKSLKDQKDLKKRKRSKTHTDTNDRKFFKYQKDPNNQKDLKNQKNLKSQKYINDHRNVRDNKGLKGSNNLKYQKICNTQVPSKTEQDSNIQRKRRPRHRNRISEHRKPVEHNIFDQNERIVRVLNNETMMDIFQRRSVLPSINPGNDAYRFVNHGSKSSWVKTALQNSSRGDHDVNARWQNNPVFNRECSEFGEPDRKTVDPPTLVRAGNFNYHSPDFRHINPWANTLVYNNSSSNVPGFRYF